MPQPPHPPLFVVPTAVAAFSASGPHGKLNRHRHCMTRILRPMLCVLAQFCSPGVSSLVHCSAWPQTLNSQRLVSYPTRVHRRFQTKQQAVPAAHEVAGYRELRMRFGNLRRHRVLSSTLKYTIVADSGRLAPGGCMKVGLQSQPRLAP